MSSVFYRKFKQQTVWFFTENLNVCRDGRSLITSRNFWKKKESRWQKNKEKNFNITGVWILAFTAIWICHSKHILGRLSSIRESLWYDWPFPSLSFSSFWWRLSFVQSIGFLRARGGSETQTQKSNHLLTNGGLICLVNKKIIIFILLSNM